MKKLNLMVVMLLATIVFVSCEKKDSSKEVPVSKSSWVLIESNIEIDSSICDKYINEITGQAVYKEKIGNRLEGNYTLGKEVRNGVVTCPNKGTNCKKGRTNGEEVLIVKNLI